MQIRIKKSTTGSTNGANVVTYTIGRVYEIRPGVSGDDETTIPESLARDFIRDGFAEEVKRVSTMGAASAAKVEQPRKPGPSETK